MSQNSIELDPELIKDFVNEVMESLETVDGNLLELEKNPSNLPLVDAVFRAIHSIKGNSAYFNWIHVKVFAHNLENLLDELRQGKISVTREVIDLLTSGTSHLKKMVQRTQAGDMTYEIFPEEKEYLKDVEKMAFNVNTLEDSLKRFVEKIEALVKKSEAQENLSGEVLLGQLKALINDQQIKTALLSKNENTAAAPVSVAKVAEKNTKDSNTEKEDEAIKTIRVSVEKVDEFMGYVGELIIMSDLFNGIQKDLEKSRINSEITADFKQVYMSFEKLSSALQKSLMEVRKIPVKAILQKVPRIVRELARQQSKEVEVELSGTSVLLDKSLIENLEAPIIHMVRNSVDHGLETQAERLEVGKEKVGKVHVKADLSKDHFILTIQDDGKGIDPEKMRKAAVKKGLLTDVQAKDLNDKEAIQLIFKPGFSSAEAVTEVSGRGVGMDVVLKNVQKCKGTVSVDSIIGKGTTITILIPLTAALMVENGLMIEVQNERYIVPTDAVREIIPLQKKLQITTIGEKQVIKVRERLYPLVWLDQMLCCDTSVPFSKEKQIVVTESEKLGCCFVVDEIIGIQQVVVREMIERFSSKNLVKGVAILGHSKPVIVLDVANMIKNLTYHGDIH